jgi:hypothetical protein
MYCRQSCRQRDYEARLRAKEHGLDENEIIVARTQLGELDDRIYVLACAIEDVKNDLAEGESAAEVRRCLDVLLDAATPLLDVRGEARSA